MKSRLHRGLAELRDVLDDDAEPRRRGRWRRWLRTGTTTWRATWPRWAVASTHRSPGASLATAVMERLASAARPRPAQRRWSRAGSHRRRVAVVVAAVLLALLATPPVRAAVADWFGFGGVVVERGAPDRGPTRRRPRCAGRVAGGGRGEVGFTVWVPAGLGTPDGVEVSGDRRVVSMSWTTDEDGVLRLDQFDATLDFTVVKTRPRRACTPR